MRRRLFTSLAAVTAVAASILISAGTPAAAADSPAASSADAQRFGVTPNSRLDPSIQVDEKTNTIAAVLRGVGKQVYDCKDGVWTFREPIAALSTLRGNPVGFHGVGPFWASFDGTRVNGSGAVTSPNPPPPPASRNVAWLRLNAASFGTGGVFSNLSFIQRIDTKGGAAPTTSCTAPATVAVDYSTNYVFWSPGTSK